MDSTTKQFYVTMHFMPRYEDEFTCIEGDIFRNNASGMIFRKRLLYDFGWGQEYGFEKLPALSFKELIKLVECQWKLPKRTFSNHYPEKQIQEYTIYWNNLYGSVSVIMQEYVEELICFLESKMGTNYFSDSGIRENFKCFSFSSSKMREIGRIPGGNLTKSYEEVLNEYAQWRKISERVISQVYG